MVETNKQGLGHSDTKPLESFTVFKTKAQKNRMFLIFSVLSIVFSAIGVRYSLSASFFESIVPQFTMMTGALIAYSVAVVLKPGIFSFAIPIVAMIAAILQTQDFSVLFLAMIFIPGGLILGYGIRKKQPRVKIVLRIGFIVSGVVFAILLYQLYLYKGTITYDAFYDTVFDISRSFFSKYNSLFTNSEEIINELSPIDILSDTIKSFLTAFLLIVGFTMAYFSSFSTRFALKRLDIEKEFFAENEKWELEISKIAAIVFLVSAFLYASLQNFDNIGLVAPVITIMFPMAAGFAIIGFKSFSTVLKKGKLFSYSLIILLLFGFMSIVSFLLILLVFIGLIKTLLKGTKFSFSPKSE